MMRLRRSWPPKDTRCEAILKCLAALTAGRWGCLQQVVPNRPRTSSAAHDAQVLTDPSEQVDKVVQLYEVMQTRHTTMLVGQSGGGKSMILNTLAKAQARLGLKTR